MPGQIGMSHRPEFIGKLAASFSAEQLPGELKPRHCCQPGASLF
jgi:hypothetical protein